MASDGLPHRDTELLSAQARYARRAAAACGYAFRSLDGADGYLFEVRDGARVARFAAGAGTPYALNDARAASIARDKAFCAEVLRQAGVPALTGEKFFVTTRWADMRKAEREVEDALRFVRDAAFPIFCKPVSASNGLYAEVIEDFEAFADYVARVGREHFAILIQPFVRAPEYRVFVLEGRKGISRLTPDENAKLDTLVRWADGTARVCLHNPSISRPEPVFAAAYKPGLVVGRECVALLRVWGVQDRTCDGCGHECRGIEADDPIYPTAVVVGALNFSAGVCRSCLTEES